MEDIINLIINNGLGVASFFALIYFISGSLKETKETLGNINASLLSIENSMNALTERVNTIENQVIKKEKIKNDISDK